MGLDRKLKLLGPELPIAEPQCWLESAVPARERKQSFQIRPGFVAFRSGLLALGEAGARRQLRTRAFREKRKTKAASGAVVYRGTVQ
jgi:hypothetical protein